MANGTELLRQLQQLMNESDTSGWLDTQTSYDYLYEAVIEFVSRTACVTNSQAITTVADTSTYDLNTDFLKLYLKNDNGEYYIKYYDGSTTTFLTWKDYEDVVYDNNTDSVTMPSNFTITPGSTYQLIIDPPPSEAGDTITIYYVKAPTKVTTVSGTYPIPDFYVPAIVKYAFWLYKYRDSAPNFADAMYKHWERQVSRYANNINKSIRPNNFTVNFKRRF